MNLEKLFSMQKVLDNHIEKEHPCQAGEDRIEKKILSLIVEVSELANETRCFKYWSNKGPSEREKVLEEYVDGVHFFISLALDFGIKPHEFIVTCDYTEETIERSFNTLFHWISDVSQALRFQMPFRLSTELFVSFSLFIGIAEKFLGFTWEEIEEAYINKNKINHERQESGY